MIKKGFFFFLVSLIGCAAYKENLDSEPRFKLRMDFQRTIGKRIEIKIPHSISQIAKNGLEETVHPNSIRGIVFCYFCEYGYEVQKVVESKEWNKEIHIYTDSDSLIGWFYCVVNGKSDLVPFNYKTWSISPSNILVPAPDGWSWKGDSLLLVRLPRMKK